MATPINVLLVHERVDDVEHLIGALKRAGFEPHWDRVANELEYCTHLDEGLDVILSEYSLSHFNASRAIELLQERGMDVPLIIVSSSIGEEEAVECMKNGAADCLPKERLGRLATAITHALDQKRLRDDMRYAEEALLESQRNISTLMSNLPGMAYRCPSPIGPSPMPARVASPSRDTAPLNLSKTGSAMLSSSIPMMRNLSSTKCGRPSNAGTLSSLCTAYGPPLEKKNGCGSEAEVCSLLKNRFKWRASLQISRSGSA